MKSEYTAVVTLDGHGQCKMFSCEKRSPVGDGDDPEKFTGTHEKGDVAISLPLPSEKIYSVVVSLVNA
jgi:hypothetical protein